MSTYLVTVYVMQKFQIEVEAEDEDEAINIAVDETDRESPVDSHVDRTSVREI